MRIGLTGASGLLGRAMIRSCALRNWNCESIRRECVDFRHPARIQEYMREYDVIVHAAANTDVEGCEREPEGCYRDNALLAEIMAAAAARLGKKFVYISSTGVYGDYQERAYTEYDSVRPTTHHHRAKLLGEGAALRSHDSLVIRTGWLFGGSPENPKNFVARRIEEAVRSDGVIFSNNEQRGNPTYVNDVSECILGLIEDGQHGIFNCVNEGAVSRMAYISKIVELAGLPVEVHPSPACSFKRLAKVSNNETATNLRLYQCGYDAMHDWQTNLEKYLQYELAAYIAAFRGKLDSPPLIVGGGLVNKAVEGSI